MLFEKNNFGCLALHQTKFYACPNSKPLQQITNFLKTATPGWLSCVHVGLMTWWL